MALTKHFYMGGHTLSSAIHKGIDLEEKEEEALICHVSFAAQCNSFDCASPLLDSWCQRWYGTSLSERVSSLAKGFSRLILVAAGAETLTFWSNRTQTIRASLSLGSRSNKKEGGLLVQVDIKTSTQPCLWHTCDYWKCLKITVYSVFAPVTVITGISSLWAPLLWIITFHSSPLLPTFFALLFSFYLFFHSTFVFATQSVYFFPNSHFFCSILYAFEHLPLCIYYTCLPMFSILKDIVIASFSCRVPETQYENVNLQKDQRGRVELAIPRYHELVSMQAEKKVGWHDFVSLWFHI